MRTSLLPLRLLLLAALGLPACTDKEDEDDGSTDSGASDGGAGDGGAAAGCEGATEILDELGVPSGYVRCADGSINRVDTHTWDPTIDRERCVGDEESRSCEVDADCTHGAYGACVTGELKGGFAPERYCGCVYSCSKDADCDPGEVCVGDGFDEALGSWPKCVPATCETGADCASGECGLSTWFDGCSWDIDLACRTEADECRTDDPCDGDQCGIGYESTTWTCNEQDCAIGRPLVVAEGSRTAPLVEDPAWSEAVSPAQVEPALAARLAAHWAEVAAMEHASVASFSRVSLELMALGAPPELLVRTQRALLDEVAHARLAFGLAGAYGGAPVGPGPLSLDGVALRQDPAAILASLVEEACVGETLGAAEAAAAAAGCADPAVKAVLQRIAADEAEHAALAWATLRWLLEAHPALAPLAARALHAAAAAYAEGEVEAVDPRLRAAGLLAGAARAQVRREALRAVVLPCWQALCQALGAPDHAAAVA